MVERSSEHGNRAVYQLVDQARQPVQVVFSDAGHLLPDIIDDQSLVGRDLHMLCRRSIYRVSDAAHRQAVGGIDAWDRVDGSGRDPLREDM